MKSIFCLFLFLSIINAQVNIEGIRDNNLDGSTLSIAFDTDFEKSNQEDFEFLSSIRYDHLFDNKATLLTILDNEYEYRKDSESKDIVENKGLFHIRYVYPLERLSIESFGQIEFDDFRSILRRDILGFGIRYNKETRLLDSLFYGVGFMHEFEKYDVTPYIEKKLIKSTNYITLSKQINSNIYLGSTSYVQTNISDIDQYRILNISEISVKISERIDINFNIDFRYEAKPVIDDIEDMYTNFSIGIVILI